MNATAMTRIVELCLKLDNHATRLYLSLARNAGIDVMVMGTSTAAPLAIGESVNTGPLGSTTADSILWAPCPVIIVPPALVPGLARG